MERRHLAAWLGALATAALPLAGCMAPSGSSADDSVTAQVSSAIVASDVDTEDTAVVGIFVDGISTPVCSGTLVAPRTIVTAGHCVEPLVPTHVSVGGQVLSIHGMEADPRFDSTTLAHDIGVIRLSSDAPIAPAHLGATPETGAGVRVAGYGRTSTSDADGTSTLHRGFQRVESVDIASFKAVPAPSSACTGDSGGAVMDESGALVGVISAGDAECAKFMVATRLDAHRDFLDEALAISPTDEGCSISAARGRADDTPVAMCLTIAALMVARRARVRERRTA